MGWHIEIFPQLDPSSNPVVGRGGGGGTLSGLGVQFLPVLHGFP